LLKDRVILVTGAGRGIGAAAAKAYAAHGATVLLLGKTEANLTQVYDEIEAAGHPQPAVIPFNLETALPHQYDELAAMIESEFGHLDGLLHNASIIGPRTPIEQLSGENFMRVMQVNVNAMFMLTSTCCRCSSCPRTPRWCSPPAASAARAVPTGAPTVSKFATEGLMQTLADEVDTVAPCAPTASTRAPRVPACAPRPIRGKPAEQPDAGRDHAGVPVPDGAGQHRYQRPGIQRPVMPCVAFVPRRLPVAALKVQWFFSQTNAAKSPPFQLPLTC
jgi:NAD(P)-dependent dehydrogenase (short-subunit alcohol dehydrogenase family)